MSANPLQEGLQKFTERLSSQQIDLAIGLGRILHPLNGELETPSEIHKMHAKLPRELVDLSKTKEAAEALRERVEAILGNLMEKAIQEWISQVEAKKEEMAKIIEQIKPYGGERPNIIFLDHFEVAGRIPEKLKPYVASKESLDILLKRLQRMINEINNSHINGKTEGYRNFESQPSTI